jgi:hypothetical protein
VFLEKYFCWVGAGGQVCSCELRRNFGIAGDDRGDWQLSFRDAHSASAQHWRYGDELCGEVQLPEAQEWLSATGDAKVIFESLPRYKDIRGLTVSREAN